MVTVRPLFPGMIERWDRALGGCGLPTQWIAKHGYLAIALTVLAGLALGSYKFEADEASLTEVTFEQRWPRQFGTNAEPRPPIVADSLAAARTHAPEAEPEASPAIKLAALDPKPASLNPASLDVTDQAAPKGYIFYFNSPTHWTPVPLPEAIQEVRAPHNRNIRAEIEQAAMLFDVDIRMMKAFARIESGYNPKTTTGKYKCLFQLSDWEFAKYWKGDIYDIRDCSIAAARKLATEAAQFENDVGRRATAAEIYCIHQQGYQGCAFHYAAPHQLAWKNMYLTAEGQERGEAWARKAIWGNVPSDIKDQIKGGVEALTSGQFIAIWTERVERFMARKSEPPTDYVEYSSKSKTSNKTAANKTPKKVAAKAKSKARAAKANNTKSRTRLASR
jgi:hypothetical protein